MRDVERRKQQPNLGCNWVFIINSVCYQATPRSERYGWTRLLGIEVRISIGYLLDAT